MLLRLLKHVRGMPANTRLWLVPLVASLTLLPFALAAKYFESQGSMIMAHVVTWTGIAIFGFVIAYMTPEKM